MAPFIEQLQTSWYSVNMIMSEYLEDLELSCK